MKVCDPSPSGTGSWLCSPPPASVSTSSLIHILRKLRMFRTLCAALALVCIGSSAWSQTLRFETNVGDFDMVLNPNDDPNLQGLVDNIVAYVGLGRYSFSAINRAPGGGNTDPSDDFVLQMGGFMGFAPDPDIWPLTLDSVDRLPEAIVDADEDGAVDFPAITNSRSTVSLALAAGDVNSGTSSFFINLGDNAFLDSDGFVPFAEIVNMDTIDRIMALEQRDLSSAIGQPGNLAFIDVPVTDDDSLVIVKRVSVVAADDDFSFVGPIASALQLQRRNSEAASAGSSGLSSLEASMSSSDSSLPPEALVSTSVPEPTTAWMLAPIAVWAACRKLRTKKR